MTREEWLKERLNGIGASEASSIVNRNPYKTNIQLWEEKTGRRTAEDISGKPCVKYGIDAEEHLRKLFALDFPQYEVGYEEFKIIRNSVYPFIFATLDGWLECEDGRLGILEIKTTEIHNPKVWDKWKDRVPDNYYIQLLHQLLATGYDFAILKAQIKYVSNGTITLTTRHYTIERSEVQKDIDFLRNAEIDFWDDVKKDRRPNLQLPTI